MASACKVELKRVEQGKLLEHIQGIEDERTLLSIIQAAQHRLAALQSLKQLRG